jgi:predicted RNase H-like HicB family nuclease
MQAADEFFRPGEQPAVDPAASATEYGHVDGYRVIFTQYRSAWSASSPDVPGVFAGGATRDDAEQRIREAIPFHLEGAGSEAARRTAATG